MAEAADPGSQPLPIPSWAKEYCGGKGCLFCIVAAEVRQIVGDHPIECRSSRNEAIERVQTQMLEATAVAPGMPPWKCLKLWHAKMVDMLTHMITVMPYNLRESGIVRTAMHRVYTLQAKQVEQLQERLHFLDLLDQDEDIFEDSDY